MSPASRSPRRPGCQSDYPRPGLSTAITRIPETSSPETSLICIAVIASRGHDVAPDTDAGPWPRRGRRQSRWRCRAEPAREGSPPGSASRNVRPTCVGRHPRRDSRLGVSRTASSSNEVDVTHLRPGHLTGLPYPIAASQGSRDFADPPASGRTPSCPSWGWPNKLGALVGAAPLATQLGSTRSAPPPAVPGGVVPHATQDLLPRPSDLLPWWLPIG